MKHDRTPRLLGPPQDARSLAFQVLLEYHDGAAFVQELLDRHFRATSLPPPERRLATQLTAGILRRRGSLDALLRGVVTRQPHEVEPWLWELLRLGVFQLALLTHIPAHAALHETVELCARFDRPRAKGFVNGVLRSVQRLMTDERGTMPSARALPLAAGEYRMLARSVLPDPAAYPVEYLAAGFSLPGWLLERWRRRFDWEECLRLGFWFAGPAPLWLRCNPLRTDRAALLAALTQAGVAAEAGELSQALRLGEHAVVHELPGYQEGWFSVQDESAMRVAAALTPQPGMRVLDMCAAPGGKTTHLAELMRNEGRILACDVDARRLQTVAALARRLGITIIETRRLDPERNQEPPAGPFDAILVDVPCSNTGVLGRRPEARWRLKPNHFHRLVQLQTKLLLQAGERIRPGGAIVYSTCSMEPEENRQVVAAALQGLPNLVLEAEYEQMPGRPADGGYWARLQRRN